MAIIGLVGWGFMQSGVQVPLAIVFPAVLQSTMFIPVKFACQSKQGSTR
jgi:hypothetical protein